VMAGNAIVVKVGFNKLTGVLAVVSWGLGCSLANWPFQPCAAYYGPILEAAVAAAFPY
jgi:hypothetical protein